MSKLPLAEMRVLSKDLTSDQRIMFMSQIDSSLKDRDVALILSVLFGWWGVDRFYAGDMPMGLLKFLTFGLCGVLWIVDIFLIQDKIDSINRSKAYEVLAFIKGM